MNKIRQCLRIVSHPRELRLALSGLGCRLAGDAALGGLTAEETEAVVSWAGKYDTFIEIGTLFGFTARSVAQRTSARVIAVDNFCWNPFGLTPDQHESFTRRVLEGTSVKLVRDDAERFLSSVTTSVDPSRTLVFLDGSHAYADVKREIVICRSQGIAGISGHDFGNQRFGVTAAVRETLGEPSEIIGLCWFRHSW